MKPPRVPDLSRTPLLGEWTDHELPADPLRALDHLSPPSSDLAALHARPVLESLPDLGQHPEPRAVVASSRRTLPPGAPEWMQAARALARELDALVARGRATAIEQAAVSRAWTAWALAGASTRQVLRVAHVVSRAHGAIRDTTRPELESVVNDCAQVLLAGLPSSIKRNLPYERVVAVVRELRSEADRWVAVVDATSELLGWKAWARVHAATAVKLAIEDTTHE
ncbi:MAG: hypothetical protein IT376_18230 [Polyangiaceae bacterium]|nr:hypothetical protein [Polyangiaceae bacterium]